MDRLGTRKKEWLLQWATGSTANNYISIPNTIIIFIWPNQFSPIEVKLSLIHI